MGVPITILGLQYSDGYIHMLDYMSQEIKYEIIGIDRYVSDNPNPGKRFTINNKEVYARILIKKV